MLGAKGRRLKRSCEARIADLGLPSPLQVSQLKRRLEAERGREIWVLPDQGQLPPEVTGLWLGAAARDYVVYGQSLHGFRLENTLLHEFAHMICGHGSADVTKQDWLRERAPNLLAVGEVQHLCMRTDYGTPDEQEAEMMASLILARAQGRRDQPAPDDDDALTAARIEAIFRT